MNEATRSALLAAGWRELSPDDTLRLERPDDILSRWEKAGGRWLYTNGREELRLLTRGAFFHDNQDTWLWRPTDCAFDHAAWMWWAASGTSSITPDKPGAYWWSTWEAPAQPFQAVNIEPNMTFLATVGRLLTRIQVDDPQNIFGGVCRGRPDGDAWLIPQGKERTR